MIVKSHSLFSLPVVISQSDCFGHGFKTLRGKTLSKHATSAEIVEGLLIYKDCFQLGSHLAGRSDYT